LLVTVLVMGPALGVMLIFDRGRRSYFLMAHAWAKLVIFLSGLRIEWEGLEKVPSGPCVFMANHQSYFDAISIGAYLPRPPRFVAKRVLTLIPIFGQLLIATGHVIIDRGNPRQAFGALDRGAEKIRKGISILVFPEGTRSRDHRLGPFKKGGFVLALKAGAPIVPVSVTGTRSMMPKGKFSFKRPKLVRVKIGEPIASSQFDPAGKEKLISEVRKAMIRGFGADTPEWKVNHVEIADPPGSNAA